MREKIPNLEELQKAAEDLNTIEVIKPVINIRETDIDVLIEDIKTFAADLEEQDELTNETKIVLKHLNVGPWLAEEIEDEEDEVEQLEELEKKDEKPITQNEVAEEPKQQLESKEEEQTEQKNEEEEKEMSKSKNSKSKVKVATKVATKPITPKAKQKRVPSKTKYTRVMAFADSLKTGGKTEEELIDKAAALYNQKTNKKNPSKKVAAEIHMYCFEALKQLDLLKQKNGMITI